MNFARYLNQYGILVVGNDHLGHGETAKTDDDWGYFCSDNMSETVVEDLYKITCFAKEKLSGCPFTFCLDISMGVIYGKTLYHDIWK